MPLTRQKSIHDQEVRTPLLESEDEEDKPKVQIHFPSIDSTECGEDITDGTVKNRRGPCRKLRKRHVVVAGVIVIIIGAVIFLYVKVHKVWYEYLNEMDTFRFYIIVYRFFSLDILGRHSK